MENQLNQPALSIVTRFNQWIQESIMVKLFSIGFLVVLLLIPTAWIDDLIQERQYRAESVIDEISSKWSDSQTLSGPILLIPYSYQVKTEGKDNEVKITEHMGNAFFLPEQLTVNGNVEPTVLHRGIFEAVVYNGAVTIDAKFTPPVFDFLTEENVSVKWSSAKLIIGLTDLGGIQGTPELTWAGAVPMLEPSGDIGVSIRSFEGGSGLQYDRDSDFSSEGIVAKLNWIDASSFSEELKLTIRFRGSDGLRFVPTGKNTDVNLTGTWADPSFDGKFLPETRNISDSTFTAKWIVSHFNRPFSQQWSGWGQHLTDAEFGLRLLVPVEQYQKSMRTSKYAQLIIILTFIALFLTEITKKIRIHPFQYILIGVALIIYYTLLLSVSEQAGFNIAYWIASLATIGLIGAYARTFLQNATQVILLTLVLFVFYSFIFVIIVQQDLSLLIGSVGLFLIVAAIMYFSRNIRWYKEAAN